MKTGCDIVLPEMEAMVDEFLTRCDASEALLCSAGRFGITRDGDARLGLIVVPSGRFDQMSIPAQPIELVVRHIFEWRLYGILGLGRIEGQIMLSNGILMVALQQAKARLECRGTGYDLYLGQPYGIRPGELAL